MRQRKLSQNLPVTSCHPIKNLPKKDTAVDCTTVTEGLVPRMEEKEWVIVNYLRKAGYILPPTSYLLLSM